MPNTVLANDPSPARAAEMLRHMSKENSETLYKLIVTVYKGDKKAQQYEGKKLSEKQQAFQELEKLKKQIKSLIPNDFDAEAELMAGLEEKYGSVS